MSTRTAPPKKAAPPSAKPAAAVGAPPVASGATPLSALKRKLIWRMGVAVLMIVFLLGGLALFDTLSSPPEAPPPPRQYTDPVPIPPKRVVTEPVTRAEPIEPPPTPAPPDAGTHTAPPSTPPQTAPEATASPVDKTISRHPQGTRRAEEPHNRASGAKGTSTSVARSQDPTPLATTVPHNMPPPTPALSGTPATGAAGASSASLASTSPPEAPAIKSPFALKSPPLENLREIEALQAKLTEARIPSRLEARVFIGPFSNRQERDAAYAKIKAMGIEAELISPPQSKPKKKR